MQGAASAIREDDGPLQEIVDNFPRVTATDGMTYARVGRFVTNQGVRYEEIVRLRPTGEAFDHFVEENCVHAVVTEGTYDIAAYDELDAKLRARLNRRFDAITAGNATSGQLNRR